MPDDCVGLGGVVIQVLEQNVFEGDHFPLGPGEGLAGGDQFSQGVFAVHRHDFVTRLVGAGVEGQGEPELSGDLGQLLNLGGEAAGGDG